MKKCQEMFFNNRTIDGDEVDLTCPENFLKIKLDVENNWEKFNSQDYAKVLQTAIVDGCEKFKCSCL